MAILNIRTLLISLSTVYFARASAAIVEDVSFQQELLHRIVALEERDREHVSKQNAQDERIAKLDAMIEGQTKALLVQADTISDYKVKVARLEETVALLQEHQMNVVAPESNKIGQNNSDESGIHRGRLANYSDQRREATKQNRALVNAEGPVAFHATLKAIRSVDHIGTGQKILFPDTMLNLGGGYHDLHGIFIAPAPGIYIFSTSVTAYHANHNEILVHLMKNGEILANVAAHGDAGRNDQGSVTVVTRLAVGDEVWVSLYLPADTSMWGDSFDSFMGCLVMPE